MVSVIGEQLVDSAGLPRLHLRERVRQLGRASLFGLLFCLPFQRPDALHFRVNVYLPLAIAVGLFVAGTLVRTRAVVQAERAQGSELLATLLAPVVHTSSLSAG